MNNNNIISNNSDSCNNGNVADQSSVLAATSNFLNLNWEQSSTDQTANFESALSSLVSSSSSSNPNPNLPVTSADSLVIRELIGRLGSICNNNNNSNSSDVSPPNSSHYRSINSSCYSTPLNSPPKLNLLSMMDHHPQFQLARPAAAGGGGIGNNNNNNHHPIPFAADPGFAERAAMFSCFGAATATARNYVQFGLQEPGKLSRVSSSQSLKGMTASNSGVGVNVNHPNPMHLQLDRMGSGIGGQFENDMVMMMMMMRSGAEFGSNNALEESSASDRMTSNVNMNLKEGNVRKRKATTPSPNKGSSSNSGGGRGKEATPAATPNPNPNPPKGGEEENSNSKRSKSAAAEVEANADGAGKDHAVKTPKAEQNSTTSESAQKQGKDKVKDNNVKPPEPPKQDYIHVRARRGQATDSHSLAERVRREKISERMKFLQDLVPGCNKVTGKAVMLDEIINYVQSLQRQVEFLSMKLATVNPRLDINVDSLLTKDVHQPRGPMMAPQSSYPLEATCNGFSYANQPRGQNPLQSLLARNDLETQCSVNNPLDASSLLRRSLGMQLHSLEGFTDVAASHLGAFWEDDLQSVVQMGFGQNQEAIFSSHNLQGALPTSHMKTEL